MDDGFGSGLWENVQAVRLSRDGALEAPVRANGRDGLVVGVHHVEALDATAGEDPPTARTGRRWWARLLRH